MRLSYPSILPKIPIVLRLSNARWGDTFECYSINSYHQKTVPTDLYVVLNALSDIYDARLQSCSYSYKKRYICVTSTYAVRTSYLLHHLWYLIWYLYIFGCAIKQAIQICIDIMVNQSIWCSSLDITNDMSQNMTYIDWTRWVYLTIRLSIAFWIVFYIYYTYLLRSIN